MSCEVLEEKLGKIHDLSNPLWHCDCYSNLTYNCISPPPGKCVLDRTVFEAGKVIENDGLLCKCVSTGNIICRVPPKTCQYFNGKFAVGTVIEDRGYICECTDSGAFTCHLRPEVCVHKNALYTVGALVSKDSFSECRCFPNGVISCCAKYKCIMDGIQYGVGITIEKPHMTCLCQEYGLVCTPRKYMPNIETTRILS
ncbi:uncharacterized protein LOC106883955 [Octopus bimaculoides]|uniref:VWFC domain-containing protein n=1 Tax=Octopus bimaculoides TaxID=37653 RepID=A0A0L8I5Q6_OCTBM|nr:uncharacterized protein LOC106883955 [Octopus bimaculoides]|eukprot:XP_014790598.1 PREDICTED: uncharacterized protein LOC106883955 isoform X2 [Octopus bimaculoides]